MTYRPKVLEVANGGTGAATLTGILAGNGTSAVTASAVTQHGVLIAGASNAVTSASVGSNGQVLVGSNSADPVFATLGSSAGSLTYTTGAGTLNIDAANYATGTWTPTIIGASSAGTTTYTTQAGFYTRVFNQVFVEATLTISAATGTGNAQIGGLPFTVKNTANYNPSGTVSLASAAWGWSGSTGTELIFRPVSNSTNALIDSLKSTGAVNLAMTNGSATFVFSCWYQV